MTKETTPTTPENEPPYAILQEHRRTDGSFKSLEELEMEYVNLTDRLIHKMTHGVDTSVEGHYEKVLPTKVIFLDKSARPVAWLTQELWGTLAPEPGTDEVPRRPDFKFLNIDREQWLTSSEVNKFSRGEFDTKSVIDAVDDKKIAGLRSIFNMHHNGSAEAPNELDNQVIMVVDEVKASGATLDVATNLISRAFPSSIVVGEHWMSKQYNRNGAIGNNDIPIWYKNDKADPANEVGRGVRNRETDQQKLAEDPSKLFLSRRFPEPDERSLRLREDLKHLASAVGEQVPYIPDYLRSDESIEQRSQEINGRPLVEVALARRAIRERDSLNNL